jgi:hypothetical protein
LRAVHDLRHKQTLGSISLHDVRQHAFARDAPASASTATNAKDENFRTSQGSQQQPRGSQQRPRGSTSVHDDPGWWSQTGSNRRPPACKAGALPAELWPLPAIGRRRRAHDCAAPAPPVLNLVGLGRLERPTSPLSGVRSNHLSYRPKSTASDLRPAAPVGAAPNGCKPRTSAGSSAKKEKRRRRRPAMSAEADFVFQEIR